MAAFVHLSAHQHGTSQSSTLQQHLLQWRIIKMFNLSGTKSFPWAVKSLLVVPVHKFTDHISPSITTDQNTLQYRERYIQCHAWYTQIMTCASQFSYSRHSKKLRIPRCQRIAPVLVIVVALSASLQCAHACKF